MENEVLTAVADADTGIAGEAESAGSDRSRFAVAYDAMAAATDALPPEQREAVRWFWGHCNSADLTLGQAGELLQYDGSTVSRVFRGAYKGSMPAFVSAVVEFRALFEARSKSQALGFVETSLASKVWKGCDLARKYQKVVFIFGDSQVGKTSALLEYSRRHNHGSTPYVRIPQGGSLHLTLSAMAPPLGIMPELKEKNLRLRILGAVKSHMCLVIDEAHQTMLGQERCVRTLEFLREVYDSCQCGLVVCATNLFRDEMERGKFAGVLQQFHRRRLATIQLPAVPTARDLVAFAAAYGLPPATGDALRLQTDVVRVEALGIWLTLLRMASEIAQDRKESMSWDHVQRAYQGRRVLEVMK